MERRRLKLHEILCTALGSRNVYFQPPEGLKMNYPCIVYSRDDIDPRFADDSVYLQHVWYSVTVVDKRPNSPIVEVVSKLPMCRYNRLYITDGLNHDVFKIFY